MCKITATQLRVALTRHYYSAHRSHSDEIVAFSDVKELELRMLAIWLQFSVFRIVAELSNIDGPYQSTVFWC